MKKLKLNFGEFECQKVSLKTIYGGYGGNSSQNTVTIGSNGGTSDDGDDSDWD
ncbi:hypothetical protein [Confluentibacter sediminis]|uniref:hypothetical protein n=1 Tax=Confluentibacter sediminis TaxID=2219045 RepID=UPI0013A68D35|nr:hypothetical protein [Confluentibacter sediminis]